MLTSFEISYNKTMASEGGYVNHGDDRGGETYKGITRRWYPDWSGWDTIDATLDKDSLDEISFLWALVEDFYRETFWHKIRGSELANQELADLIFDTAVHTGVPDAIKYLQAGLNLCNRNGHLFKDLIVAGLIGSKTLSAVALMVGRGEGWAVYGYALLHRAEATLVDLRSNPSQEVFAIGWLKRFNICNIK